MLIDDNNLEECLDGIRKSYRWKSDRNKVLMEENKKLKDEHYKDEELSAMKEKLNKMEADYWRGFRISNEESEAIEKWKKKHDDEVHGYVTERMRMKAEGCCGGRYKYVFVPTSIGVSGKIVCNCGTGFEFQKIG